MSGSQQCCAAATFNNVSGHEARGCADLSGRLQDLRTRYCAGRWDFQDDGIECFRPSEVKVERYRYRGTRILLPWMDPEELGTIGRFARTGYDDPTFMGALQESLTRP